MKALTNPVPFRNHIFVKDAPKQDAVKTTLIATPEMAQIVPKYGEVLDIPKELEELGIEKGDLLIYSRHVGTVIKLNGEDVRIISPKDVLGIQK